MPGPKWAAPAPSRSIRDGTTAGVRGRYTLAVRFTPKDAIIPAEKLRDYVLSPSHPDGRAKAAYLARLGYSQEAWPRLEADLRQQILTREAEPAKSSPYGQKYEILGPLMGPNGATAWVRAIWIVLTGEQEPRLVTLVPEERP